jgi:hypothetical protein
VVGFWLGSGQDGLGLVMAGCVGYDGGRDLACVIQGLGKVVCQPLVVWLCVDPRSFVPFNELMSGWEVRLDSHSN